MIIDNYNVFSDSVTVAAGTEDKIEAAVLEIKPKNLESLALVAVYAPEGQSERNLTFRLTYRHADRTLVDKEVDKEHGKVLAGLPQKLPVRI